MVEPSVDRKPQSIDDWIEGRLRGLLRWRFLALSTVGAALCGAAIGKTHGWALIAPLSGVIVFGLLAATIVWARDRLVRIEKARAAKVADEAKHVAERLWATLHGAGLPLMKTLGDICARSERDGYDSRSAMITQVLHVSRRRLGQDADENRVIFYERQDADTLRAVDWQGRGHPPRHLQWERNQDRLGRSVLEFLDDDQPLFQDYPNVFEDPPDGLDPRTASYRSFLTIRVVAGSRRLGILTVDSPHAGNFELRDRNALSLLSGLLAAGIAAAERT
ncbi:hypothetical protein [Modestobacter sp. SYSU DS0290]